MPVGAFLKLFKLMILCVKNYIKLFIIFSAESWANLGISFSKMGKNREALKAIEEAHKISRRNYQIIENLIHFAIDCEDIQKIIVGMNDLFDMEKQERVTPYMFYKLITIVLSKYSTLESRQIEYYKDKIYLIFDKFSMTSGTTPEIWDLYIFFIDSTELKLNKDKLQEGDIQKFYQAMMEIRLKQTRNYMIMDVWEKDEKLITNISLILVKIKTELERITDKDYKEEVNNFVNTLQTKIDKFNKQKEFEKNN